MTYRIVDKLLHFPHLSSIKELWNKNRWNSPFISTPNDASKLRRFLQNEMTQTRLNLQRGNVENIKKISLDALNKFSSLHPHSTSDYGPPTNHKQVLHKIVSPSTKSDQILQNNFLAIMETIINTSLHTSLHTKYNGSGNIFNSQNMCNSQNESNILSLGLAHVSAALIPNCISIYIPLHGSITDLSELQFKLLGITSEFKLDNKNKNPTVKDLVEYSNKEGMSVCLFSGYLPEYQNNPDERDFIRFMACSPDNLVMIYKLSEQSNKPNWVDI